MTRSVARSNKSMARNPSLSESEKFDKTLKLVDAIISLIGQVMGMVGMRLLIPKVVNTIGSIEAMIVAILAVIMFFLLNMKAWVLFLWLNGRLLIYLFINLLFMAASAGLAFHNFVWP